MAAGAATTLVFVVGAYRARHDDALDWARHAEAALALVPEDVSLRAELVINIGVIHNARGEIGLAQSRFREAMAMLASQPRGQGLASAMQYLGVSYLEQAHQECWRCCMCGRDARRGRVRCRSRARRDRAG